MKFSATLSLTLGFVILAISACTEEKPLIPLMTCTISQKPGECSTTPSLASGKFRVLPGQKFTLDGLYDACFHQENVAIQGKLKGKSHNNRFTIELLATKIQGLKPSEFPSTIAVITLEQSTLRGLIRDIWANIRSPISTEGKYVKEIICKTE